MTIAVRFLPDDICEVELDDGTQICSCITGIPGDQDSLTVHLYSDPLW